MDAARATMVVVYRSKTWIYESSTRK